MSKPKVQTTTGAVVTLTLEISNVGSWGPDCDLAQVYGQAREAAVGRIRNAFRDERTARSIRIVGTPVIKAITTDVSQTA